MKKLLIIFAMLIAFSSYSQDGILISNEQAKEAIKAKQRVAVMEVAIQQQRILISEFKQQVSDLKQQVKDSYLQNELWEENYDRLKVQFEAEKAKKPKDKTFTWILRCIGVGAVGFVVGNL